MQGKIGRPGGPPRLNGTLRDWRLIPLFGGWVVVGWLDGDRFSSAGSIPAWAGEPAASASILLTDR